MDPFKAHLVALLSIYELGPFPGTPIPRYEGPTDWQTESILKSFGLMARRMCSAEETVSDLRKQLNGETETIVEESTDSPHQSPEKITSVVKKETPSVQRVNGANMTISLDGLQSSIDPSTLFSRAYGNMKAYQAAAARQSPAANGFHSSAPPTAHAHCPTCGRSVSDPIILPGYADMSPDSSPLVIPMGPLAAAAFESGMSAVEELKLLKAQVQDVARVCNAVARGDLSQKITVVVQGVVMVQLKDVINTMVDKLGQFAKEVTRVSQEVGTEGKLGGQALVLDVEGTWRELTGVVNKLAANLTSQVRSIAKVTKAVALGDLSKQIEVDARGEILDLKNTVNGMVVRLRALRRKSLVSRWK